MLNTKQRKNIVKSAKKLIKKEVPGYNDLPEGSKMGIQDEYIDKLCKERGYGLSHFYAEEGEKLDRILSTFD